MFNEIKFVTLALDSGSIYLTNNQYDMDHGGNTYLSGKLELGNEPTQKIELSSGDYSFNISAVDKTMISAFESQPYINRLCTIHKVKLDANNQIESVSVENIASITNYSCSIKEKSATINLTISAIDGSLSKQNSFDLGVVFADHINDDQTVYWGKNAPASTGGSGIVGGGDRKHPVRGG